ncbi:hypothetical protein [Acidovorax sp. RAC01]|uniref:hypothetical protein n=1 Tax=Acidovorax sp. RAC01 TaxID=1842533 RepID=UPI0008582765|nr:hypothetical protein [Acidovorax sp. RAC01]AOG21350.1 hypothetical protein BSY15_1655 [Acidovorax sp. RAC01]
MTPQEFFAAITGVLMPRVTADFLLWGKLSNKVKVMPIWHVRFRPIAIARRTRAPMSGIGKRRQ